MDIRNFEIEFSTVNGNHGLPLEMTVKIATPDGDIFGIEKIKLSALNGGELHIVAQDVDD